jgi:hypothetical protein
MTIERNIDAQISVRHDLHAVAAHAVSHPPPAARAHHQQSFPLLEKLRRCALPPRAGLPGLSVLLAALHKMPIDDAQRVRAAAEPLAKLLWIGSSMGAEGRQRF